MPSTPFSIPPYPAIEPYQSGYLTLSALHQVDFEQCGNPQRLTVLFVHGGPGGGYEPMHRRYFDPSTYRIILFEQRGAGRSRSLAELTDNTAPHLIANIERLRQQLHIERWLVFGGSWGSTLGLAYAEAHPDRLIGLMRAKFSFARAALSSRIGSPRRGDHRR
jgi:proline iminopeptidase